MQEKWSKCQSYNNNNINNHRQRWRLAAPFRDSNNFVERARVFGGRTVCDCPRVRVGENSLINRSKSNALYVVYRLEIFSIFSESSESSESCIQNSFGKLRTHLAGFVSPCIYLLLLPLCYSTKRDFLVDYNQ